MQHDYTVFPDVLLKADSTVSLADLPSRKERDADLLQHGIDHCDVIPSEVIQQFGTWVVTKYGIECLTEPYAIEKARFNEDDWIDHVTGKTWVKARDFIRAYRFATETRYKRLTGPKNRSSKTLRFEIFRRDNYRCQICGRSAQDGARLEVDHKVPRSRGGPTSHENLWTLCFECNRGKKDKSL